MPDNRDRNVDRSRSRDGNVGFNDGNGTGAVAGDRRGRDF